MKHMKFQLKRLLEEAEICKTLKTRDAIIYEYKDDKCKVGAWNENNTHGHKSNSTGYVIISKVLCVYLK